MNKTLLILLALVLVSTWSYGQTLSGTVFEDANYGGGAGRSLVASGPGGSARPGVTVELYDAAGAFVATALTNAAGTYSFSPPPGTYTVRVVSGTVSSARPGYAAGLLPVPTYNGTTDRVGGEAPQKADAPANTGSQPLSSLTTTTTTVQAQATATVGAAGPDFGFNFSTIVNTNDAGPGSLRQFMLNANALGNAGLDQVAASSGGPDPVAGTETSLFMISDGRAHDGLRAGLTNQLSAQGVAIISPASELPAFTDARTALDGTTQTQNVGNTNNVTLGTGGTVGTAATALSQVNGPEVQLQGSTAIETGLNVTGPASSTSVSGLALLGFGTVGDGSGMIRVNAPDFRLTNSVLGTTATSFTAPAIIGLSDGMRIGNGGNDAVISNTLFGFNGSKGITINGTATGLLVTNCEFRANAQGSTAWEGIDLQSTKATVRNNLFVDNIGNGVDSFDSAGSNVISGNTIVGNGRGTPAGGLGETPGVRVYGANNIVSNNIISDNYGAGILLQETAATTVISQNSIFNNGNVPARNGATAGGQVGIDLNGTGQSGNAGTAPFVTLNSSATAGANALVNYPVLTSATIIGSSLLLRGFARPGAVIEVFLAQPNPAGLNSPTPSGPLASNFGQGRTYLFTLTEGATSGVADGDGSTGAYGPTTNGFAQGSDASASKFSFSVPLGSLPAAQQTLLATCGTQLTSTATLSGATSEFSGNVAVGPPPVAIRVRGELPFCAGGSVRLSAGPWPVGTTFTWLNGATIVNGAGSVPNDSVFVASAAGAYTVRVNLPSGCPGISDPVTVSTKACPQVVPEPCSLNEKFINTWYFGDKAGLDFNAATSTVPPVVLTNGQMNAPEGTSTTSDANGQALFYSNGYQVWNRNNVLMPNGAALGPASNTTITDGPVAVRQPGSTTRYYLFTQESEGDGGLSYSEIDMTLDGGLGDVVAATRNTPLVRRTTEKMTAVLHANGCDVWVIVHGWGDPALGDEPGWPAAEHRGDAFLAFRVTPAGVQPTPVVSKIGPLHAPGVASLAFNGQMKVSPDGRRLALVRFNDSPVPANGTVELYDFSDATGAVTNPLTLDSGGGSYYGVEFSPDQRKLYATILAPSQLLQFDLDAANIPASKQVIATSPANLGSIQAGPDGKLYVCRQGQPELGVITRPDSLGTAASYVDQGQALGGRPSGLGLPNFVQSFLVKVGFGYRSTACQVIEFQAGTSIPNPETYAWNFGEPGSGANNTASIEKPSHTYAAPGTYTITLRITKSCLCKEIKSTIFVPGSPLPGSIAGPQTLCGGALPAPLTSTAPATEATGQYTYQWQSSPDNVTWSDISGATGPGYAPGVLPGTTYFRRRAASGFCAPGFTASVLVTVLPALTAGAVSADQQLCAGATPAPLASTAPASGGTGTFAYQWEQSTDNGANWTAIAGATGASYAPGPLSATTQYRRQVSSGACAVVVSGAVTITVAPVLATSVSLSPPPVQCAGTALTLTATPGNAGPAPTYRWLVNGTVAAVTGPTFSSSTLTNGDQVRVELTPTPGLCSTGAATATVTINQTLVPTPAVAIDVQPAGPVCPGELLTFSVARMTDAGPAPQYQWQVNGADVAGATGPTFSSTTLRDGQTVTLRLRATTACGPVVTVASNGIAVRISPPVKVDAGPDKQIRAGQSVTLEGSADGPYPVTWTPAAGLTFPTSDRLRPVVAPLVTTTYTLSAGAGGCAATDQVTVVVRPSIRIPNVFTPNGDGIEDTWQIEHIEDFPNTTVRVFNRWGNQIFSSENYSRANEWKGDINGQPAPVGTYYYVVVTKGPFGQSYSGPLTVLY